MPGVIHQQSFVIFVIFVVQKIPGSSFHGTRRM